MGYTEATKGNKAKDFDNLDEDVWQKARLLPDIGAPPIDRTEDTKVSLASEESDGYIPDGEAHDRQDTKDQITVTTQEEQRAREALMVSKGHQRYEDRQKRLKGSQTEAGHSVISSALKDVSVVITKYIQHEQERVQSGNGKPSYWFDELKDHDPLVLAYLGLNTCYDSVVTDQTYGSTLANIGSRIENESFSKGLKEYDKRLHDRLVTQVTKAHSSDRYRFKAARIISGKEGYSPERWSGPAKVSVASPVINAILEACDIFMITETSAVRYAGKKLEVNTNRHLSLTDAAAQKITDRTFDESWSTPMFGPLVVPPRPWTSFNTGVYQDEVLAALTPLVRKSTKEQRMAIAHDFEKGTPDYVKALNALQATPLRLNEDVYAVISWIRDEGKTYSEFPAIVPPEKTPYPEFPEQYSEEYLSQIIKDRKKWHEDRREAVTNSAVLEEDLRTMEGLSGLDEFWLGWSFDFRGRMYPCSHFNYHRADHIKASFMLANGKHLDETAKGWLMIQIANVGDFGGISKKSLNDRIDWTLENEKMILDCADDFKGNFHVWTKADKPMQFLAACFEYRKFIDQGADYVCHLPISLDGTNSGTQHYAMALRNYEDGLRTNLVPSDHCYDIYQIVADEVIKALKEDGSPEALHWLSYGITRKTVKRNCMCYGYSSQQPGMGDQIVEDIMHPLQREVAYKKIPSHPFGDARQQGIYARFLAGVNYKVISQTLSSVQAGMKFLQSYADALAREQKSVRWTSPSGFPCVQRYTKSKAQRVKLFLYDRQAKIRKQTRVNLQQDTNVYDTRKARSAVSANTIHSLDAGHMNRAIQMGLANGISDYFLIHDSFGTTCADTWTFYHCIRVSLVEIYEGSCVFGRFEAECRNRLADPDMELEAVPTKGSLNIADVVNSEYCFS